MPELHLKLPGFTYSACGTFTKNKERTEKFMQTGNTNYIYKNDLDKAFQHYMAYGKFKYVAKRTQSDQVLRNKAFEIAKNPKCDGYQRGLSLMVYKLFVKTSTGSGVVLNQSSENLKEGKFIYHLKTIFGVHIYLICN